MPLDRTEFNLLVDDDGSNLVGTIWDKAHIDSVILDPVDAELSRVDALETNAALKNAANTFTQPQLIQAPAARLALHDTTGAVNAKRFAITASAPDLYVQTQDDAGGFQANALRLERSGHLHTAGGLYERNRSAAVGEWTVADVSAYCRVAGFTGPYLWTLVGRALILVVNGSATLAADQPMIGLNLPPGLACMAAISPPVSAFVGGWDFATTFFAGAGATYFDIYRKGAVTWPTGAVQFSLSFVIPLQ